MITDQQGDAEQEAEHINTLHFLPVTEETSTPIKEATETDEDMHTLKTIIRQGWPERKDKISQPLAPYFSFRDELMLHDGLTFKGERLVILLKATSYIKSRIHASHIAIKESLRLARESI